MKKIVALFAASSMPAQAHESLATHAHPHGLSMLVGKDAVIGMLFALAVALIAFWRFGRVR
jgi:type III secretory pathway component EscT